MHCNTERPESAESVVSAPTKSGKSAIEIGWADCEIRHSGTHDRYYSVLICCQPAYWGRASVSDSLLRTSQASYTGETLTQAVLHSKCRLRRTVNASRLLLLLSGLRQITADLRW